MPHHALLELTGECPIHPILCQRLLGLPVLRRDFTSPTSACGEYSNRRAYWLSPCRYLFDKPSVWLLESPWNNQIA